MTLHWSFNDYRQSRHQAGPTVRERDPASQQPQQQQPQQPRNYGHPQGAPADHQRYSYAGYEPEREFKDYTREREVMLRQRNNNNQRQQPVEYTAR